MRSARPTTAIATIQEQLNLTPRQAEVLYWVAEGKTNDEIAEILGCSFFTVKNHLKQIFKILAVPTRAGAAVAACRAQIVTSPAIRPSHS